MNSGNDAALETPVRWLQSLRFALLLLSLLLTLIFGSVAVTLNQQAVATPLSEASAARFSQQQHSLQGQFNDKIGNAERLAQALNDLTAELWGREAELRHLGQHLLEQLPPESPVIAAGIWPEPREFQRDRVRSSLYWTIQHDGERQVRFHNDYNNTANISYHGESWYTPTRHQREPGCYWTQRYTDPFLRKAVITCAIGLRRDNRFIGATSIVLDPQRLHPDMATMKRASPFYLLLDHGQHILNAQGIALEGSDTLPALAQHDKRFGQITVQLHNEAERRVSNVRQDKPQWREEVDKLSQQSRQLSQLQAEHILARLHADSNDATPGRSVLIKSDALHQTAVRITPLSSIGILLSGQNQASQLAGVPWDRWLSASITAGAIAIALLLSFVFSGGVVLRPLHRLIRQLRLPAEDTHVDTTPAHEIGVIGELVNARHAHIRRLLEAANRKSRADARKAKNNPGREQNSDSGWAVIDAIADAVAVSDTQGNISYLNHAAETLTGWNLAQARGLDFDEVFHILDQHGKQRLAQLATRALQASPAAEQAVAVMFKTRSGHHLPSKLSSAPIRDSRGAVVGAAIILNDARSSLGSSGPIASELRDKLTGLLNRQAFDAELASRCEAARQNLANTFALLYLDVDHMQDINQAFGSEGGDEFLRQLGRLIQSDVGENNPAYRLNSDKFGVLIETADPAAAQLTAELLSADVQSWGFQWHGERRDVSVSTGLIMVDKDSGRPADVLRQADALCQQAQNEGRGRIISGRAQADKEDRRDDRNWLTNIKKGLAEDRFHLSTQQIRPLQRNSDDGHVFSTLTALEDDEGFWTGADTFMPVAERHDLAEQLDRWTIDQVFKHLIKDPELTVGIDFCIISLSVSSMQSPRFLDFMIEHFKDSAVSPNKICLDLSENNVHTRLSSARDFCRTMHRAGCRLSLSGVSTRPSSYKLIRELPVQLVRFDPALTHSADRDPVERLATESLHRIVHTLGKQSMALQVNSAELLRVLQGIGINYAQGDAIARPTPIVFQAQA